VLLGFGTIGFVDDYLMQVKKRNKGLSARGKLMLQTLLALITGAMVVASPNFTTQVTIPFFKNFDSRSGVGVCDFFRSCHRGGVQCGQPHRWVGRAGHRAGHYCSGHLYDFRLCRRPYQNRRVPADQLRGPQRRNRPSFAGPWPVRDWGFSGSTHTRPRSSWGCGLPLPRRQSLGLWR
jgi:hypothetical protein